MLYRILKYINILIQLVFLGLNFFAASASTIPIVPVSAMYNIPNTRTVIEALIPNATNVG